MDSESGLAPTWPSICVPQAWSNGVILATWLLLSCCGHCCVGCNLVLTTGAGSKLWLLDWSAVGVDCAKVFCSALRSDDWRGKQGACSTALGVDRRIWGLEQLAGLLLMVSMVMGVAVAMMAPVTRSWDRDVLIAVVSM